ncbi:polysaccharide deacetylase family protein [Actinomadura craniellae]|uniref:Polysaccharide deacetylase family protein n=2 Tax=Actinomadura craniellae TaxID=2231787 RepID=A0A365H0D1_9ACTN|nr:polysaccharide deacetylase family protein [Actinomadura craniellae]
MYHSIHARPPAGTADLAVHPEAFADQMALLAERGFTPVPFSALDTPARKPIVITFDDGYADFHDHALPVLAGRGFPATVFVTTGWLADAGADAAGRPLDRMLSWGQVREAAASGIEIGGHSHSHPQLDQLRDAALREELTRSKGLLEDRLGREVATLAYPYGYSSARVRRAARRAGYTAACAVANALAGARRDPLAVPRLTVRATTSPETFARVVEGRSVTRTYLRDRMLTKGYAVVRRSRYAAGRVTSR